MADLFAEEDISDVGLEEIELVSDDDFWEVTVGFSRPWDHAGAASITLGRTGLRRTYKVLRIDDIDGKVASVKDRILRESNGLRSVPGGP